LWSFACCRAIFTRSDAAPSASTFTLRRSVCRRGRGNDAVTIVQNYPRDPATRRTPMVRKRRKRPLPWVWIASPYSSRDGGYPTAVPWPSLDTTHPSRGATVRDDARQNSCAVQRAHRLLVSAEYKTTTLPQVNTDGPRSRGRGCVGASVPRR
jgi:hypothetical protein